jgi:hypothetical protein
MIITFKSKASGDVIMFADVAERLMLIGVDPVPWTSPNPQERMSPWRAKCIPQSSGPTLSLS